MPPAVISTGIFIVQQIVKYAPGIAEELRKILNKPASEQDWMAIHAKVNEKSYKDYVPATALNS